MAIAQLVHVLAEGLVELLVDGKRGRLRRVVRRSAQVHVKVSVLHARMKIVDIGRQVMKISLVIVVIVAVLLLLKLRRVNRIAIHGVHVGHVRRVIRRYAMQVVQAAVCVVRVQVVQDQMFGLDGPVCSRRAVHVVVVAVIQVV